MSDKKIKLDKYQKVAKGKIDKILENSKASLTFEGLEVTEIENDTIKRYLQGKMTEKEVLDIIKNS